MNPKVHYPHDNSHLSLLSAITVQPTPTHHLSLISILLLSSILCIGVPSGLFPSEIRTEPLYTFLLFPLQDTRPVHLNLVHLVTGIFGETIKLFTI